ncbi:MAG: hypothetical protein ACOYB8_01285 [Eubacteriaceae bacterium]|jgi:hypothetical protein
MKIEIYEAFSRGERSDEDILIDGLLEELEAGGDIVIRYDPLADEEEYQRPRIAGLLESCALPYFFKDGELCFTGSYDLNRLHRKLTCGGCKPEGCPKAGTCTGCSSSCSGCNSK